MKKNIFLILTLTIAITFCLISQIYSHGSHHHHHGKKKEKSDSKSPLKNHIQNHATNSKNSNSNTHSHDHEHDHEHEHDHADDHPHGIIELYFSNYIHIFSEFLQTKLAQFTKKEQAYLGVMLVSSASVPIFLIILLFNIKNIKLLNAMTAFAAGALLADVLLHNLPEIFKENEDNIDPHSESFFKKKEIYICFGVIFLFAVEKIISLLTQKKKKNDGKKIDGKTHEISDEHSHDDGHGHNHHISEGNIQNIIISVMGDFVHNLTDGLAIGAAFGTNLKLGITLTISIFFHEIPHEIGDFCYLLKQKMNAFNALTTQVFAATGAFLGVYLSFTLGDQYSGHLLSFASGAFIYLSVNTILGDLKKPHSVWSILIEVVAFVFGVYFLSCVI